MNAPFTYPPSSHVRRHGPRGYLNYSSFRPWLRDEFSFRCVYCLIREQWGRVRGIYAIDHFQPVAHYPARVVEYDNLLYACTTCNLAKGTRSLPDPLLVLTSAAVRVAEDGTIQADDPEAARLIDLLRLDRPESTEFRRLWIEIVALAARYDQDLFRKLMGFPEDLPNLRLQQPPGGNTRPKGIDESWFSRKQKGELPETY